MAVIVPGHAYPARQPPRRARDYARWYRRTPYKEDAWSLGSTPAVGALSFQIYALIHPELHARIAKQNAEIYRQTAAEFVQFIPVRDLPIPAEQFVRVIHALTDGILFNRFLTPDLITDEVIRSAFEMLTLKPTIGQLS